MMHSKWGDYIARPIIGGFGQYAPYAGGPVFMLLNGVISGIFPRTMPLLPMVSSAAGGYVVGMVAGEQDGFCAAAKGVAGSVGLETVVGVVR